jgi:hypothetical protein
VDEFQGEELTRTNKPSIILIDEIEGQEGEQIGEDEVDREVRVCVADKTKPVVGRGWSFFARCAVKGGPIVVVALSFAFAFAFADIVLKMMSRCRI